MKYSWTGKTSLIFHPTNARSASCSRTTPCSPTWMSSATSAMACACEAYLRRRDHWSGSGGRGAGRAGRGRDTADRASFPVASNSAWRWRARDHRTQGRAALTSPSSAGQEPARRHAARGEGNSAQAWRNHDFRDARPGRGAQHIGPHRGHVTRPHLPNFDAWRALSPSRGSLRGLVPR